MPSGEIAVPRRAPRAHHLHCGVRPHAVDEDDLLPREEEGAVVVRQIGDRARHRGRDHAKGTEPLRGIRARGGGASGVLRIRRGPVDEQRGDDECRGRETNNHVIERARRVGESRARNVARRNTDQPTRDSR